MNKVYVLLEEREESINCKINGVWDSKEKACKAMLQIIEENPAFNDKSVIDIEEGIAESDPDYCEDVYCNYFVKEFVVE